MKFLQTAPVVLFACLDSVLGREIPNPARQALYDTGDMHMRIMGSKRGTFAAQRELGAYNSTQYPRITTYSPCVNGISAGEFRCKNVDLAYFASHAELGSKTGEGSSSWGWTDPTGREFIIIAQVFAPLSSMVKTPNTDPQFLRPMVLPSLKCCPLEPWTTLEDCHNKALRRSGVVSFPWNTAP